MARRPYRTRAGRSNGYRSRGVAARRTTRTSRRRTTGARGGSRRTSVQTIKLVLQQAPAQALSGPMPTAQQIAPAKAQF